MATAYHYTDTGFPSLSTDGAANLIAVIKACLVTGYGSKSGAGWTIVYEDTTTGKERIALSNGNGVIEFVRHGAQNLDMLIWDSIDTPGSGAFHTDDFATVMSEGVNGWKSQQTPAPGIESDSLFSLYAFYFSSNYIGSSIGISIFADDKSAWISTYYPDGQTSAEPGDNLTLSSGIHFRLFLGAVISPDLPKGSPGNLFISAPMLISGTTNSNTSSNNTLQNHWGLRSPMGTLPTDNQAEFNPFSWNSQSGSYEDNPQSSVRAAIPVAITYEGSDVPNDAGVSASRAMYSFGVFPGIIQLESANVFWGYYSSLYSSTWNLESHVIAGSLLMPFLYQNKGHALTDDSKWWG